MLYKLLPHILLAQSLSLLLISAKPVCAQQKAVDLEVQSGVYGSFDGSLPFWLHTNRYGKTDSSSTNWINEVRLNTGLLDNGNLSVDIGGNLVGRVSKKNSAHFSELYLQANYRGFLLSAGRFIDPVGLNNHELSTGSMMVSRNATPVPKISISNPTFLNVPFTDGHLQYKGMFSHGWLEQSRFVDSPFLHQKFFYLKVNVGNFSGTGGMIHNVVWGGTHPEFGRLPRYFGDYLRVISGQGAREESSAPGSDISNALGNAVAAYEFVFDYEGESYNLSLTRLFYLEDRVSTRFRSPWDGTWGFNLTFTERSRWLNTLAYKHFNTKQQDAKPGEPLGRANYYNNSIYRSGWTYENRVLGLPLFSYDSENNRVFNNIFVGHHLGAKGVLSDGLSYRLLLTFSRNYGDDYSPGEHSEQFSGYLGFSYSLPGTKHLSVFTSLATDIGELYPNSLGLSGGLKWKF